MAEAMHECKYNPGFMRDTLIPQVGIITDIRTETPDVKTFRVEAPNGGKLFGTEENTVVEPLFQIPYFCVVAPFFARILLL